MAETYWPFDAGSGSSSGEDRWYQMAPLWALDGVVSTSDLAVTTISGRNLQVATGSAWCHGAYYVNDAARTHAIAANASGNPRIDRIVLRRDLSANTVTTAVVQGTAAASPTVPALTQVATGIWEIPIAQYRAETGFVNTDSLKLTDERVSTGPAAPLFRHTDLQAAAPNASDLTAGSMTDMITGLSVAVPTWARDGSAVADMLFIVNGQVVTFAGTFACRLVVATTNGLTSGGYQIATSNAGLTMMSPLVGYTIPVGTTSLSVKWQAQRTAGSGALRVGTSVNSTYSLQTVIHK